MITCCSTVTARTVAHAAAMAALPLRGVGHFVSRSLLLLPMLIARLDSFHDPLPSCMLAITRASAPAMACTESQFSTCQLTLAVICTAQYVHICTICCQWSLVQLQLAPNLLLLLPNPCPYLVSRELPSHQLSAHCVARLSFANDWNVFI